MSEETSIIEYRPYTRADEDQIVALLRVSMKMQDFPDLQGFWRWKHYENPFGESPGLVAVAGEQVVGVRVFLRWEWHTGETVYRAVRCVDTATHPDWGRRGIFERLTTGMIEQLPGDGVDFIFNTPNEYSMPGYLKMGWVHVGALPLKVRVRHPGRVAGAALRHEQLGGATEISNEVDNSAVLERLRDPAVRAVVEQAVAVPEAGLHTALTPAYLEWRYGKNRWYDYRVGFDGQRDASALAICRVGRTGLSQRVARLRPGGDSGRGGQESHGRSPRSDWPARPPRTTWPFLGSSCPLGVTHGFVSGGGHSRDLTVRHLDTKLSVDPTTFRSWAASFGDLELF